MEKKSPDGGGGQPGAGGGKAPAQPLNLRKPPAPEPPDPNAEFKKFDKQIHTSDFNAGLSATARKEKLPTVWSGSHPANVDPTEAASEQTFDGLTPAEGLDARDLWRAIKPAVSSREGARAGALYAQVINQFAVGHNPRYNPDELGKPRAHIFIWDVSRAMNAEIPHMVGARELTLTQTLDWLRYEASQRGWVKVMAQTAVESACDGKLVVVTPKQGVSKVALMAILRPEPLGPNGQPRVAAAAKGRGNDLPAADALGVFAFEFFMHA